jgi:hypothetical protein
MRFMTISPLGWVHTVGSFPAIPLSLYMLATRGRIAPETKAGKAFFWFMLLGTLTVYPIAHAPASLVVATLTLAMLLVGFGISKIAWAGRFAKYIEAITLSISVFLLLVPTVSESLRRLPVADPLVKSMSDPVLLGALGALLVALAVGIPLQLRALYQGRLAHHPTGKP